MIDLQLTNVLPRRIVASLIDLGVVGLLSALVARSQASSYAIDSRNDAGDPIWSTDQLTELRIIEADHINRQFTLGDTMWVWFGRGLLLSLLAIVVFSLVAWVLVPANTGWSAGHRIMGLRVVDRKGDKPPLDSYLRRYLVGILDLAPFVVPGLLGWFVASRNESHQRIGDLSAETLVIDANQALSMVDPDVYHTATATPPDDMESMVKVEEVISQPDFSASAPVAPAAPPAPAVPQPTGSQPTAPQNEDEEIPILQLEDTAGLADPPSEPSREILEVRDIPPSPEPANLGVAPEPAEPAPSEFVAALEDVEASASEEAPEQTSPGPVWHMPAGEPSPVWVPDSGEAAGLVPDGHAATAGQATATAAKPQTPQTEPTAGGDAAALAPMWNEEWQAWLFWDPTHNQWLRHEPTSNVWVPIQT